MRYKSQWKEYNAILTEIDIAVPSLKTKAFYGKDLSIEFGEYKATLKQNSISSLAEETAKLKLSSSSNEPKLIAKFDTHIKPLWRVACTGTGMAWLSCEDQIIRLFDRHTSSTINSVNTTCTCSDCPYDMVALDKNELLYSDVNNGTVNHVQNGRSRILFTVPDGWQPRGMCTTISGDILVCLRPSDFSQHRVVRYQLQEKKILQIIDKDEFGNSIFSEGKYGMFVEENNNGDILVSDMQARVLIGLEWTGKVRFRYKGATLSDRFNPRKIVTDSINRILLTDPGSRKIHILNIDGHLLTQVQIKCDIPVGLSLDMQGKLWVGLFESGKVLVFEYST
ncbi:uncharacterized protein LOC134233506 [Saccostrea cucullata]|uniref:uncharacterized protein LOC134233506 n=1 Tax=Saccostrea cuccullata TaxID=36930 RepID=UPI002ED4567E